MRGKVSFYDPSDALRMVDGVPLVERVLELEVGPCIHCGMEPDVLEGGMIENISIERGVLRGNTVCHGCMPPGIEPPGFFDTASGG